MRLTRLIVSTIVLLASVAPAWSADTDRQLLSAVKTADTKVVRRLLSQGADVNATEADGTTALHRAVQNDDLQVVRMLLAAGASPKTSTRYGVAPIHVACINGNARMLETLLKAGAGVNTATPGGETVLMTCARTGKVDALTVLLDHGADVNAREAQYGQTALMWASAQKHPEAVKLLLNRGADLNARSKELRGANVPPLTRVAGERVLGGFTPLLFAVREGDIPTVEVLLDAGAKINEPGPDGTTPLVLAILNAHFELAAMLLDRGADPNAPDVRHGSALHALAWVRRPGLGIGMGSAVIYPRIPTGNMDSLAFGEKLLQKGANPNVRIKIEDPKYEAGINGATFYYVSNPPDVAVAVSTLNWDGATPFWVAAKNADAPLMRLLARNGADPLLPNRVKVTPLMAAAGAGYMQGEHPGTEMEALESVKAAVELGNDVNAVADFGAAEDKADLRFSGLTALHGAAQRGANAIVEFLVARGARVDIKTREGWTPFNIAEGIQIGGTLKNSPATAALLQKLMTERGIPIEHYRYEDKFTPAVQ